jgi:hypothetical protein
MRRIEMSEFRDDDGSISLENRIRGTIQNGLNWYNEMAAQDEVFQRLNRTLGNEQILLCNLILPGTNLHVPQILIGPQGVRVFVPTAAKGVFRAKGEEWLKFGSSGKRFTRAKPNLISLTQMLSQTVLKYLRDYGYPLPEVEGVLIFTNPRTHVDSLKPSVRIVLTDAIDHFAANLQKFQPIMDMDDIRDVKDVLIEPPKDETEKEPDAAKQPAAESEPVHADMGMAAPKGPYVGDPSALTPRKQRPLRGGLLGLPQKQLIVLGVMAFFQIIILIVLVLLVVANTLYS